MWTTTTSGVNNFFSGVSKGSVLKRLKRLKSGFLSLFLKLVQTLKTMVYNYFNSINCEKNNGQTFKPSNEVLSKNTVKPSKNDSFGSGKWKFVQGI